MLKRFHPGGVRRGRFREGCAPEEVEQLQNEIQQLPTQAEYDALSDENAQLKKAVDEAKATPEPSEPVQAEIESSTSKAPNPNSSPAAAETPSQSNAVRSAKSYLEFASFSGKD
jgi:hypothetical protein